MFALQQAGVRFAVIGEVASRARGAGRRIDRLPLAIDIVPASDTDNHAALQQCLTRDLSAESRLICDGVNIPLTLDAAVFGLVPIVPLTTRWSALNIISRPIGGGWPYESIMATCEELDIYGTVVAIPSAAALVSGLARGIGDADAQLIDDLRRIAGLPPSPTDGREHVLVGRTMLDEHTLNSQLLTILGSQESPATIRSLLLDVRATLDVNYKQVERATRKLVAAGTVQQSKRGNARVYRLNDSHDARLARTIAELLTTSTSPEQTAYRALDIVRDQQQTSSEDTCSPTARNPMSTSPQPANHRDL